MGNYLHKTADPVDFRVSVSTNRIPGYVEADWFANPDVSAVFDVSTKTSLVPKKYWSRPLADPVTEMSQAEKDAVDAAEATVRTQSNRDDAVNAIDAVDSDGVRVRALLENANQRINYLINRVIQLENALSEMMAAGNFSQSQSNAITQAGQSFPQTQTAQAATYFAAISTRDKPTAVQAYKDDINSGNQDT